MSRTLAVVASISLVCAAPVTAAFAAGPTGDTPDTGKNILVTVQVGGAGGERAPAVRSYELILGDGERGELHAGSRIPIPATTFNSSATDAGGNVKPITSFTYQNIGTLITCRGQVRSDGRVRLEGSVETSMIVEPPPGRPAPAEPTIATVRQTFSDIVLKPGTPLVVNRVADEMKVPYTLTVTARVLD